MPGYELMGRSLAIKFAQLKKMKHHFNLDEL
ncbi:hypothetical protein F4826_003063 [Rahnella inusitata]|nr:hypothetical protein [Rahnella inusitata]